MGVDFEKNLIGGFERKPLTLSFLFLLLFLLLLIHPLEQLFF